MSDLTSKRWIVAKGAMFLVIAILSSGLILSEIPTYRMLLLILLLAWSSARFYYFLFYVLERYVDSSLRYAGVIALMQTIWRRSQDRS